MSSGSGNGWPDAIKVPAQKADHDPLCPTPTYGYRCPRCDFIAKVRADEREQRDAYWQPRLETAWVQLDETTVPILRARTALADLRAKVEALPHRRPHRGRWIGAAWVLRDDVLDLIDGSSNGDA